MLTGVIKFSKRDNSKGFTLIELMIVMLIIGIMLAGILQGTKYLAEKRIHDKTQASLEIIQNGLTAYLAKNGNYPCPAQIDAARGVAADGLGTDCNNPTTPSGIVRSGNVRIGGVPYRDLEIAASDTVDGRGQRIVLAMTEPLAISPALFNPNAGAIDIVGKGGTTVLDTAGSAHFFFYGPGDDALGAYSNEGTLIVACGAGSAEETENCDGDTTFRVQEL